MQADEILVKPMPIPELVGLIREKLEKRGTRRASNIERVASILERDAPNTIAEWFSRVKGDDELTRITLDDRQRTEHLPKLIQELVHRLRALSCFGTKQSSEGAVEHGKLAANRAIRLP